MTDNHPTKKRSGLPALFGASTPTRSFVMQSTINRRAIGRDFFKPDC
jgi:hypothetical protein